MAILTIICAGQKHHVHFSGEMSLRVLLAKANLLPDSPCGGHGHCGKCAVTLYGAVSAPNDEEQKCGVRLACQAAVLNDATVILPAKPSYSQIELGATTPVSSFHPMPGQLGLAVDIGTTTLAAQLYDLSTGTILASSGLLNPQTEIAADVMGRIGAAMHGQQNRLHQQCLQAVHTLWHSLCKRTGQCDTSVDMLILTGNTTMLYLLTGRPVDCLSHAPFEADTLFGELVSLFNRTAYLPPCMNAFVGADITCAVLASGMCEKAETAILCDIGTNGEIVLWHNQSLYVTSTAAGPAFEGAGISCGCGSVAGAIDRVWEKNNKIHIHTIQDGTPCGICGSGLIDAVAHFLRNGQISETGRVSESELHLSANVYLSQNDIRSIQMAKAAIATGIEILLQQCGIRSEVVDTLYLAGGFGSHLDLRNAAAIGLLPSALVSRTQVIGNAALTGAGMLLLNKELLDNVQAIARSAQHINLALHPSFNELYVENMLF